MRLIFVLAVALLLSSCAINSNGRIAGVSPDFATATDFAERANEIFDGTPKVFVSSEDPETLARRFSRLDRLEVLQEIYEIGVNDNGTLTARDREQSVVFVVWGDIGPGTEIRTSFTYSRSKSSRASKPTDSPFTQEFLQTVQAGTNVNPLIIINGTYSVFKGDFIYELKMNGRTMVRREVIVPNDAN